MRGVLELNIHEVMKIIQDHYGYTHIQLRRMNEKEEVIEFAFEKLPEGVD